MKKDMDYYLKMNIKEIMDGFPAVAVILSEAGIGCMGCTMGTCPLGEIVNVHGLSSDQEYHLLSKIASILFPGEIVTIEVAPRKNKVNKNMCPPIRKMMNEHEFILRFLVKVPEIIDHVRTVGVDEMLVNRCVEFIKVYADGYHHAKEEAILFTYFDGSSDIIGSFLKEHDTGRVYVKNVLSALQGNDANSIAVNLELYSILLKEHITKEDTILYPWMNRDLTDNEVGDLFSRCLEVDTQYRERVQEMEGFVSEVENKYK